ncbi:MAG: hypothetical protein O7G83_06000 [Proteobacteria bacterium]|nr:hypothetical protein [Pseudomonadota bacterium]
MNLDGPRYQPAGKVQRLVVLLHGLGAEGQALAEMAWQFTGRLPGTAVVAPNAPFAYDSAASGYQWFSVEDPSTEFRPGGNRTRHRSAGESRRGNCIKRRCAANCHNIASIGIGR